MFTSTDEVQEVFFKEFTSNEVLKGLGISVVYARKNKRSNNSKTQEEYPRIVLLDTYTRASDTWRPNEQPIYEKYEENGKLVHTIVKDPLEFLMGFQVSAFFTSTVKKNKFNDWLFTKFRSVGGIYRDTGEIDERGYPIEDCITYVMSTDTVDHNDGIFEIICTFELRPLVYLFKEVYDEVVEQFNVDIKVKELK